MTPTVPAHCAKPAKIYERCKTLESIVTVVSKTTRTHLDRRKRFVNSAPKTFSCLLRSISLSSISQPNGQPTAFTWTVCITVSKK